MKQKKNNIDCTPTKQEEGAINELISWCEKSDAVAFFKMTCKKIYDVTITVRKKGAISCDEFSLEQYEAIKAMAEEKLVQVEDKQKLQDIIDVCECNIADAKEKAKEQET